MSKIAIGIDLGGTHLRMGVIERGRCIRQEKIRFESNDLGVMLPKILDFAADHPGAPVGFAIAAMLSGDRRMIVNAPNLGWKNIAAEEIAAQLCRPVALVNDVDAISWGEYLTSSAKVSSLLCVMWGSGIGAGLITDGHLFSSPAGATMELGHLQVAADGPQCNCGNIGCLEMFAGGHALQRRAQALMEPTAKPSPLVGAQWLHREAVNGNEHCRAILDDCIEKLGLSLAHTLTLCNPERLVLGGGVLTAVPELRTQLLSKVTRSMRNPLCVTGQPQQGDLAGLIGAADLAVKRASL